MAFRPLTLARSWLRRLRRWATLRTGGGALLERLGVWNLCLTILQARLDHRLLILGYHRVLDREEIGPLDPGVISCTPDELASHLRLVRRYLTPITFAELARGLSGGSLPTRPVIVTIDDGYLDTYTRIYPRLRAAGFPATLFLATGYLDERRLYWWDLVTLACHTLPKQVAEVARALLPDEPPTSDAGRLLHRLKRVPNARREAFVAQIEAIVADLPLPIPRPILTWEQVRELAGGGMELGGHTVTHPVLSQLEADRLRAEIAGCRERLREETSQPVLAFAYPVGGAHAINDRVVRAVAEAGYQFAATYIHGGNDLARLDRFTLRRLRIDAGPGGGIGSLQRDLCAILSGHRRHGARPTKWSNCGSHIPLAHGRDTHPRADHR